MNDSGITTIRDKTIEPFFIEKDGYGYHLYKQLTSSKKFIGSGTKISHIINFLTKMPEFYGEKYDSLKDYLNKYEELTNKFTNNLIK